MLDLETILNESRLCVFANLGFWQSKLGQLTYAEPLPQPQYL